jgi:hypothetical protein
MRHAMSGWSRRSCLYGNAGQGGSKGGEGCILGGGCMHEGAGLAGSWDGKAVTGFFACILPKRPILLTSMAGWILILRVLLDLDIFVCFASILCPKQEQLGRRA